MNKQQYPNLQKILILKKTIGKLRLSEQIRILSICFKAEKLEAEGGNVQQFQELEQKAINYFKS
jgi:hypothetical protein